ncbi:MAG: hydroxymethylbilane synthase [Deltaproteobacteria bacterium]|jgi:hydroxymethylbilane synthase|nr:hydroxymethylbilane synthase [Deltaproteobacteria bacterium]MBW2532876.1 hydroxymethylbilane synthase [Deltaproteobacteria bacterium]
MSTTIRLATRRSALARVQAGGVAKAIAAGHPGLTVEELLVTTSGDRFRDRPLQDIGGKGLFLKEIEQALVDGRADVAVHSIKDVPAELAPGLVLAAIPARVDPRDVLVTRTGGGLESLARGARVGTSSLRRRTQLLEQRADLEVIPLRGNVDTRLGKVEQGEVDAVVLAAAGLERLGLSNRATAVLDPSTMLPAVGQGALGIECRSDDPTVRQLLEHLDDLPTRVCVTAERSFMEAVEGSCRLPVAAHCIREGDQLWIRGMLAEEDGSRVRRGERRASWTTEPEEAARIGRDLGDELRSA